MPTRVVHLSQPHDVYIGRPSMWGNPFKITPRRSRTQAIRSYAKYLLRKPHLITLAKQELRGKVLGCFCYPLGCHGDVLAAFADRQLTKRATSEDIEEFIRLLDPNEPRF